MSPPLWGGDILILSCPSRTLVSTLAATIFSVSYSPLAYMIWGCRAWTSSISGFLRQLSRWPLGPELLPKNAFLLGDFHVDTLSGGFSGTFAETLHDFMQLITSSINKKTYSC